METVLSAIGAQKLRPNAGIHSRLAFRAKTEVLLQREHPLLPRGVRAAQAQGKITQAGLAS
jgi:hypothetical protein